MKDHKISEAEERYFISRVRHWQKHLSLGDWLIEAYKGETDGGNNGECELWRESKGAHIRIKDSMVYRPTKRWIDRLALHEVCHVLLADLQELVDQRSVTDYQKECAIHTIIRRLETAFCGPEGGHGK